MPAPDGRDPKEVPVYTVDEAAGYLKVPPSTLRAWMVGQHYVTRGTLVSFQPVIEIADPKRRMLSFINLVEAFVLTGIRRRHTISLPKVREAMEFLRTRFNRARPLADEQFETDGVNLFVRKYGELVGANQQGQTMMDSVLRDRLKHLKRDGDGMPQKLVIFPAPRKKDSAAVIIDPRIAFACSVLEGTGIRTAILAGRFLAGEMVGELAQDYGAPPEAIENAIRCELRAA